MTFMGKKFNRIEKSWILYDWANSVYATIVMAAVFPIYFSSVARSAGAAGDVWWGYATSIATFIIAITAPLLGAIGDFKGMKKKLFIAFLLIGSLFTLLMAFTDNITLMLVGYILSYIGFAGSNLFYDSFLTDVTTLERMDRVSAYGFGLGYIGGSTIPFLASIALITFGENFGVNATLAVKISLVLTTVWWLVFSIPFLKNVKQLHYVETPSSSFMKQTFKNIGKTFRDIVSTKKLFVFTLAYFFYIDGVGTVIHMATSYGSTLGLNSTMMILALLVTQLVAFPCSILFSKLSGKIGTIKMLCVGILVYIVVCIVGFFMGQNIEVHQIGTQSYDEALKLSTTLFWILSVLVGTSQGGIQALSRSYFGKIIPPERSNEFFGFFDIFGKFAAVIGPALYALFADLTGRSSIGILSLLLLFFIGGIILLKNRRLLEEQ